MAHQEVLYVVFREDVLDQNAARAILVEYGLTGRMTRDHCGYAHATLIEPPPPPEVVARLNRDRGVVSAQILTK